MKRYSFVRQLIKAILGFSLLTIFIVGIFVWFDNFNDSLYDDSVKENTYRDYNNYCSDLMNRELDECNASDDTSLCRYIPAGWTCPITFDQWTKDDI